MSITNHKKANVASKPMLYIGIDPGSTTGIAIWKSETKELNLHQFSSHAEAMQFVSVLLIWIDVKDVKFRVEDARLAKTNAYFARKNDRSKDQGVGAVKALSKDWEAFCQLKGVAYEMVAPNSKLTKVTPEYFEKLTGVKTLKTHSHKRDAALLIYGL